VKEEFNKDMQNLRRKNQTETLEINGFLNQIKKNTGESHSSRLEQVENRISGLKGKINIKEKNRRIFRQKIQTCERNMQELRDSIKRPCESWVSKKEKRYRPK
jgi:cob(I)alamin adenosyltransferase